MSRPIAFVTGAVAIVLALSQPVAEASPPVLKGKVLSGKLPLAGVHVTLYRSAPGRRPVALGASVTRRDGSFRISYRAGGSGTVLYLLAGRRLASVLGTGAAPRSVVVNERTTVAAGFALAQFVSGRAVTGRSPGLGNAAGMAQNLADARTGAISRVLVRAPNGRQTSTLRVFNSLANMLTPCVRANRCATLFRLAKPPRGPVPRGTLAAVAAIARNPWQNVAKLFALSRSRLAPYRPTLTARPDAWTLALRFLGDGKSVDGPGNIAIDAHGNVWVTNNYVFSRDPQEPVCGGKELLKFTPTGRFARGSPYPGGGLDGAGFGITLDPDGNVWVGNFGFAAPECTEQPLHNSVSEFSSAGEPLSGAGFTQGGISWPQGTVSDRQGNIWIANCGNGTVAWYPDGNPGAAQVFGSLGIDEPFDIALNLEGQAFVTGNASSSVAMLNPNGTPARAPITGGGLDKPLGIAADSRGNMWVSNSGLVDVPCTTSAVPTGTTGGSVTFISASGVPDTQAYTGGGLTVPWGIAVDGNDTLWVANFAGKRLSQFCGARPSGCPPGKARGEPISPQSGYGFDGLVRNTGVQIDPSGNVWVCNNWKTVAIQTNPGGYQVVAFVGLARPIETPLIGPPRPA